MTRRIQSLGIDIESTIIVDDSLARAQRDEGVAIGASRRRGSSKKSPKWR
jgi:hypothetical protein